MNFDRDSKKLTRNLDSNSKKSNEKTEGVSTILGDPKKAILKFQPLIIAMIIAAVNNVFDGIWIAGLGQNALAAVGFITPLLGIITGLSSGLSNGALSVISRFIGSDNKKEADNAAIHILVLTGIFSLAIMLIIGLFLKPLLAMLGATGVTLELGLQYGYILFICSFFPMFTTAAYGILRAEGNIKKTIYAMSIGTILNIILDPIFIYVLNMGIIGGSIGTIISLVVASAFLFYWFKKSTYIDISFKNFKYRLSTMKKILTVGIPGGSEFLIIAILVGLINMILVKVSGTEGVAVFAAGWNILLLSIVVLAPLPISVITTVGASLGGKKYENFEIIQNFSMKLGILIASILAIGTFILAPYIAGLFTYSPETTVLNASIVEFLRIMVLFFLFVPIGSVATAIFLGLGKGLESFMLITIRQLILSVVFAYILAIPLGFAQQGVWWGIVIGNMIGSLIALLWSKLHIKKLIAAENEDYGTKIIN